MNGLLGVAMTCASIYLVSGATFLLAKRHEAKMKASKALTEMKEADAKGLPIPAEAAAIWKAYETARIKKI